MKLRYIVIGLLALFTSSCDRVNDDLGEADAGWASEPSLIAKCEACGNRISKQAEECPTCGHPNPIFITEEKRKAKESKRLAEVEEKNRNEVETKNRVSLYFIFENVFFEGRKVTILPVI